MISSPSKLERLNLNDAYRLMHLGVLALGRAERQGIRVDLEYANKKKQELTETIDKLTDQLTRTKFYKHWKHSRGNTSVNINSNQQLAKFLYEVKKLPPAKITPSGQGATDEEALEALDVKELNDLLQIRKLKKLRDTYLNGFIQEAVDGYIHPFFNLHFATTYRSSSDSPNFQNIPIRDEKGKEIRKCLCPRPGHQLLEVDYGMLEVRIAACYHKDPTMIEYIESGRDMHKDLAEQIFFIDDLNKQDSGHEKLRDGAKNGFVFPQFYGDYYGNNAVGLSRWGELPLKKRWQEEDGIELPDGNTLAQHLRNNNIRSLTSFTDHLKHIEEHFWNERFPVYKKWKDRWYKRYLKRGYFDTLTGFRCSGFMSRNDVINYPVQGSAFHCLLWSFVELDRLMRKEKWKSRLIGQIHDSILFDLHPSEKDYVLETVKRVTCEDLRNEWPWIIVPLQIEAEICEVDQSWYYKEKIKNL